MRRSRDEHSGANRGADEGTDRGGKKADADVRADPSDRSDGAKKNKTELL